MFAELDYEWCDKDIIPCILLCVSGWQHGCLLLELSVLLHRSSANVLQRETKLLNFVNCPSSKETETVVTKRSSLRNRNWIIGINYCMFVFTSLLSREMMKGWGFPWSCPAVAASPNVTVRPQWVVSQGEALSRALVTGRTLSIKSPCKAPFLCSAATLLTPTNSWGNINSPVEKIERERKRVEPSCQSGTDEQSEEVESESWGVHSRL